MGKKKKKKKGDQLARIKYNQYVKKQLMKGGTPAEYNAWLATQGFK